MIWCYPSGSLPYLDFFEDDRGTLGVEVLICVGRGWARWMATRSLVFDLRYTRNGICNSTRCEIFLSSHSNNYTNGKPIQTGQQDDGSDPGLDDDQCSTKSMTDDVLNYQYLDDRAYHSRSFRSIYWYAQSGDEN